MTANSEPERASVERRIVALRESIYALGSEPISTSERESEIRSAIAELRQLETTLISVND